MQATRTFHAHLLPRTSAGIKQLHHGGEKFGEKSATEEKRREHVTPYHFGIRRWWLLS